MSMHHVRRKRTQDSQIVFVAAVIAGLAASAAAQTIRGTLTGIVNDSSGAVVPGATVTARNAGSLRLFSGLSLTPAANGGRKQS